MANVKQEIAAEVLAEWIRAEHRDKRYETTLTGGMVLGVILLPPNVEKPIAMLARDKVQPTLSVGAIDAYIVEPPPFWGNACWFFQFVK